MFDRVQYKRAALAQLRGRWRTPVLATLVVTLILAIVDAPGIVRSARAGMDTAETIIYESGRGASYHASVPVPAGGGLLTALATYFILGVLAIAQCRMYLELLHTTRALAFSDFITGFSLWLQGFLGFLWMLLWTCLWGLLLVIPGIVKLVSYSQMFFVLAEYPEVGVRRAMNISKVLTRGYKADLCVMYLSFAGWFLLSILTASLLDFWLLPYVNMTLANAYQALKLRAIETNSLTMRDFQHIR